MKRHSLWMAASLLVASSLSAQVRDTTAPRVPAAPVSVPAPVLAPPESLGSLSVVVRTHDGRRVDRAVVTARSVDSLVRPMAVRTAISDPTGYFRLDSLRNGRYLISVDSTAWPATSEQFAVQGSTAASIVLPRQHSDGGPTTKQTAWTVFALILYGLTILIARWHRIARPVHAMIESQLYALRTRLETEVDPALPQVAKLIAAVEALQKKEENYQTGEWRWLEYVFWSRGRENATWVAIHEIERELAAVLAPSAQVESYLRWAEAELRNMKHPTTIAVADAMIAALAADQVDPEYRRALLGRGVKLIYAERDSSFSGLMEWQNKASWLILAALTAIAFLTGASGHAILFLAGAAGGYSSRLMRALKRDDVPLDYGASWTTLFLSPIFGALTGWFGIALITLAARPELNLLGPAFRLIDWYDPYGPVTIGVAFLMGFSERLFDAVVGALDKHAGTIPATTMPVLPPAGVPAPAAGAPGAGAPPVIAEVVHQRRADGAPSDALIVTGSGFVASSTATINGTPHALDYVSPQSVSLPLTPQDLARIDAGGDSEIAIANPGGATSNKKNFV